jgi:hypothetical protein
LRHERLQQEQIRQNLNLLEKKRKAEQQHLLALEVEQACTRQLAEQLYLARVAEQSKVASLRAFHSQRVAEVNRLRINTRNLKRNKTTSFTLSPDKTQPSAPPLYESDQDCHGRTSDDDKQSLEDDEQPGLIEPKHY